MSEANTFFRQGGAKAKFSKAQGAGGEALIAPFGAIPAVATFTGLFILPNFLLFKRIAQAFPDGGQSPFHGLWGFAPTSSALPSPPHIIRYITRPTYFPPHLPCIAQWAQFPPQDDLPAFLSRRMLTITPTTIRTSAMSTATVPMFEMMKSVRSPYFAVILTFFSSLTASLYGLKSMTSAAARTTAAAISPTTFALPAKSIPN